MLLTHELTYEFLNQRNIMSDDNTTNNNVNTSSNEIYEDNNSSINNSNTDARSQRTSTHLFCQTAPKNAEQQKMFFGENAAQSTFFPEPEFLGNRDRWKKFGLKKDKGC